MRSHCPPCVQIPAADTPGVAADGAARCQIQCAPSPMTTSSLCSTMPRRPASYQSAFAQAVLAKPQSQRRRPSRCGICLIEHRVYTIHAHWYQPSGASKLLSIRQGRAIPLGLRADAHLIWSLARDAGARGIPPPVFSSVQPGLWVCVTTPSMLR